MTCTRLNPEYQAKGHYTLTEMTGAEVEFTGVISNGDIFLTMWTDYPTKRNGYRVQFGGAGIKKTKITNGTESQVWLIVP